MKKLIILIISLCVMCCSGIPLSGDLEDYDSDQDDCSHDCVDDGGMHDSTSGHEDTETGEDAGTEVTTDEDESDVTTEENDIGSDTVTNTDEESTDTDEDDTDTNTDTDIDTIDTDTGEEVKHCKNKAMITISFDDSHDSAHSIVMPELDLRGMKGTFYSVVDRIIHGGCLDKTELQEIAANGHEIGSHTMSHSKLTELNDIDLEWELEESKLWLEEVTGQEIVSFASPMGFVNSRVMEEIQFYYENHRGSKGTNTSGDNPYFLKAYEVSSNDSVSSVIELIDDAIENEEWLILFWHNITKEPTGWTYLTNNFTDILDYIEDQGMRVVTTKKGVSLMNCLEEEQ